MGIRKKLGIRKTSEIVLPPQSFIPRSDADKIAVVAIVRDEAEYIAEWLDFHRMVGVDRFYIYDNGSKDDLLGTVEPYQQSGLVHVTRWNTFSVGTLCQELSYAHAIRNCDTDVKWLIFIDIDEFLFSETNDTIRSVFERSTSYSRLTIPRFDFGPSNHVSKPAGGVIENYLLRDRKLTGRKSAIQPAFALASHIHTPKVSGAMFRVHTNGDGLFDLRLNHYYTKSLDEFKKKQQRGWLQEKQRRGWLNPYLRERISKASEIQSDVVTDESIIRTRAYLLISDSAKD